MADVPKGLKPRQNPLFEPTAAVKIVDLQELTSPTRHRSRVRQHKRELVRVFGRAKAAEFIEFLDPGWEIYGFTRGQFYMLELLRAISDKTGPAELVISTWTTAKDDILGLAEMRNEGRFTAVRWLLDASFQRREPEMAAMVREHFTIEAVRIAQVHSKFALIRGGGWRVVVRTSMNFNMNPRFEDVTVGDDPELYRFIAAIIDEIWTRLKPRDYATPGAIKRDLAGM